MPKSTDKTTRVAHARVSEGNRRRKYRGCRGEEGFGEFNGHGLSPTPRVIDLCGEFIGILWTRTNTHNVIPKGMPESLLEGISTMARAFRKAIALAVVVGLSGAAHSHEFIAKPAAMTVPAGAELQVAGLSTHVFLIGQELEAPKDVKVG